MRYTLSLRRISIHALREEGDSFWGVYQYGSDGFLSTPSARRATAIHVPVSDCI